MTTSILVIGASGYIGSKLVPALLAKGHHVKCLVRDQTKLASKPWFTSVEIFEGDVLTTDIAEQAFSQVSVIYYLVHSMASAKGDFADLDRRAAGNVGTMAKRAGVERIIFLGGLGSRDAEQSDHLRSRHEVGDILRSSGVPVTEFRAAVIIGAGSFSFEMIHHLANRLPVMICPRWVFTRTQPISVEDVLRYLVEAILCPQSIGKILDIGGPEVLTYRDMMLQVAKALGLRRWLIEVPVLTPRLSSYWVGLVTPVPIAPARALIEGLRHETICENDAARQLFDFQPQAFDLAVRQALSAVLSDQQDVPSAGQSIISRIEPSHLLSDRRQVAVKASAERLYSTVSAIGGDNGWHATDLLWKLRGLVDELFGGVGLRRGRRDRNLLSVGDALDFWRVEEIDPGRRILLRAEMKLPGKAWLEFEVGRINEDASVLTQTARFYPRGLFGIIYWYGIYPVHVIVFRNLAAAIGKKAESMLAG